MRVRDTDKEQLVVAKAIELIAVDGFQGFSMNKLAKACSISVATLYIYYKDKDDLIKKIGGEIFYDFFSSTTAGFSPDMSFEAGLWKQWQNRAAFALKYPNEVAFVEVIKNSPHWEYILNSTKLFPEFKVMMGQFMDNAIQNKELLPMTFEVYWSLAYGPLYTLLSFHREGKSMGGKPFKLSQDMLREAFKAVIKSLTP